MVATRVSSSPTGQTDGLFAQSDFRGSFVDGYGATVGLFAAEVGYGNSSRACRKCGNFTADYLHHALRFALPHKVACGCRRIYGGDKCIFFADRQFQRLFVKRYRVYFCFYNNRAGVVHGAAFVLRGNNRRTCRNCLDFAAVNGDNALFVYSPHNVLCLLGRFHRGCQRGFVTHLKRQCIFVQFNACYLDFRRGVAGSKHKTHAHQQDKTNYANCLDVFLHFTLPPENFNIIGIAFLSL